MENEVTDRTLYLKEFWRRLHKFTLTSASCSLCRLVRDFNGAHMYIHAHVASDRYTSSCIDLYQILPESFTILMFQK